MFSKFITVVALMFCTLSLHAAEVDTRGLTDAQVAELKSIAAKSVSENEKAKTIQSDPTKYLSAAAGWGKQAGEAAEGFGRAFTIAARELGITVNEFLDSPAGKLTAGLIIWKVLGASLVKMLFGVVFITTGLMLARVVYKRLFTKGYEKVEYSRFGGLSKGTKLIRIPKSIGDLHNDGEWLVWWFIIIIIFATLGFGSMFFTI